MGIVVGRSHAEKRGDHQKKKFFINDAVEALITFNEEHQGLLKLQVLLGWEWGRLGRGENHGAISKRGYCRAGSGWWTAMVGRQFLVVPLWKSTRDGLTGKAESGV